MWVPRPQYVISESPALFPLHRLSRPAADVLCSGGGLREHGGS